MTQCACVNLWPETLFRWHSQQFHKGVWQLISKFLGKTHLAFNENALLQEQGYALASRQMIMLQPHHQYNFVGVPSWRIMASKS